ncbi:MAG: aldo/keto reductase [Planctomycetes bacterium]|nr:aldo/keto reductase [Planctomycetota bacterium]
MEYHRIADTDLNLSALCYGMMSFGTELKGQDADRMYIAFRQAGGNFFDTAHCYAFWLPDGLGASERELGQCLRRHGDRDQVVIATKGGHPAHEQGYPRPDRYLSSEVIASDITESLQRLDVEMIDLYYLHRDDTRVSVGEIIETLNAEIAGGRLRYLGASNWSIRRIAEANDYARSHGLRGFVASQPQWNLARSNAGPPKSDLDMRSFSDEDAQWHAGQNLAVIPYSPTACGYFATDGKADRFSFDNPVSRTRLQRTQQLAAELGCTPNQVALAYLRQQPFVVIPIIGTKQMPHLLDALGALRVKLTADQVRWLCGP